MTEFEKLLEDRDQAADTFDNEWGLDKTSEATKEARRKFFESEEAIQEWLNAKKD